MYDFLLSNNIQAIRLAIANGSNVNKASKLSQPDIIPLCFACKNQNIELIQILLDSGADINIVDDEQLGTTPLIIACQQGNTDIVRLLLDSGANINLDCELGFTPLTNACAYEQIEIVRLLVERGADVNLPCLEGENPLSVSIECENIEIIKILLKAPTININQIDDLDEPHLIKAVLVGSDEIIEMLINSGANVNIANETNITPLMAGVEERNFSAVKILLLNDAIIPNNLNYFDNTNHDLDQEYENKALDLVRSWPTLINLYVLDYLGMLNSIDFESIFMLNDMFYIK
jgi:ankyrin repeat protein